MYRNICVIDIWLKISMYFQVYREKEKQPLFQLIFQHTLTDNEKK